MTQRLIDLLPESARVQNQAKLRSGRHVAAVVTTLLILAGLVTMARMSVLRGRERLASAEKQAAVVLALEAKADRLRAMRADLRDELNRYDQVAAPIPISGLLASVIDELPESVSLDTVAVTSGYREHRRSARSREIIDPKQRPPRRITAEIGGFAVSDADIAELVERLSALSPLESVTLDFSRSRVVRDRIAREFRLSFSVDLDQRYVVSTAEPPTEVVEANAEQLNAGGDR